MIEIKADKKSYLRVKEQLELLMLSNKSRNRILKKVGQHLVKKTKKDIRNQRDPDGVTWKKRKKGKGKMFKKLVNKLVHYQKDNNRLLYIGWPSRRGFVANRHHEGGTEKSGLSERMRQGKKLKEPQKTDPATREQAKELRDLGFRLQPQGRQKRGNKATVKFITTSMTVAEAAKEIAELENKIPSRDWNIDQPKRRLIGISPKRVAMIIKREMKKNRSK